uniref:Granulins domain-containing protein n=1 Tax=Octopus bimaculoides TaxID=37653 RepID=A0A0L8G3G9_OCTBM
MIYQRLLQLAIFMAIILQVPAGRKCKWSNEDCSDDSECCSHQCKQAHPGTNYRCTQNPMNYACIYDYHCVTRLICGSDQRCCAGEWGDCMHNSHCCDPAHNCIEVKGFIYKRCLEGKTIRTATVSIVAISHCLLFSLGLWLMSF